MVMLPLLGLMTIMGAVNWLEIVFHLLFFIFNSAAMNILISAAIVNFVLLPVFYRSIFFYLSVDDRDCDFSINLLFLIIKLI